MSLSRLPLVRLFVLLLASATTSAFAQETVIPVENVRIEYAQVLRVEPVYQTLTATRAEQHCDDDVPATEPPPAKGLSRIVGKVKEALTAKDKPDAPPPPPGDCRMVQVRREFRRPIAFDVDYMYKGMKYRSRLQEDPGNRLRIRVSVTPYVAPIDR